MANGEWRQTSCILCYVNCGLEVATEGRAITRVRGDKSNARSHGYLCQKPQRLTFYGNHADRLTTPLRRRPDGTHEPVTWDVALAEIAARLRALRDAHGGDAFGFYGGGGQGNHLGGAYFRTLKEVLGATKHFNALSQEKTGDFWVNGRLFGKQVCHTAEDVEHADLLVVVGCNPWMANGFQSARNAVNEIKSSPDRRMIVVDPRRTEVADVADLHLQLKPGTDAFLLSAMLAILLRRGGEARDFLDAHTVGFDEVAAVLRQVPIESWVAHADVPMADVERAVDMVLAAQAMCVRVELGIQQSRHSTLNSYLEKLLYLLPGHFGRRGTNNLHTWLQPLFRDSQGERSPVTGQEIIGGLLPTNRFADEVLSDDPRRVRAVWVDSNNPANTAADTTRLEEAFGALDLSVVVDVAYTETAALADWVLPAAAQYEKWETTLFSFEWPNNFFQLRAPLFDPLPGTLPEPEIYARVLRAMGELPSDDVLAELRDLAARDRGAMMQRASGLFRDEPRLVAAAPILLYLTLGATLPDGAAAAAPLWAGCHRAAAEHADGVRRALDSTAEGPALGELLFERVLASRSGVIFTAHQYEDIWTLVAYPDRRVHLAIPEMLDWLARLDPIAEQPPADYPYVLVAGQRRMHNANQIFRTPAWRKSDPDGALRIHPDDLAALDGRDGGWMAVETPTGRIVVRAEADASMRHGLVALPHGYGQSYPDRKGGRIVDGPRLNLITAHDDCDPIAATPYHKNVAVRLAPVVGAEAEAAEAASQRVRAVAAAEARAA
ncbi:MAG TPA: molybdopterin-dependent oxidoreductase [Candidatus Binatia bacterium]|nr:molybdopterin-dependent oxidoreductase [Candidatus Binatia bacterium]